MLRGVHMEKIVNGKLSKCKVKGTRGGGDRGQNGFQKPFFGMIGFVRVISPLKTPSM
jgi:hypothetical protein